MTNKSDYFYDLPPQRIAQTPIFPRDHSKLLYYNTKTKEKGDKFFYDLPDILQKGDVLVRNNTKVLPARLLGKKAGSGGGVEFLLLKRHNLTDWNVLSKPAKRLPIGAEVVFSDELSAKIIGTGDEGERTVRFFYNGVFEDIISRLGQMPLPPYIRQELKDQSRYQTIYAQIEGSSAAPTAGLHFTDTVLARLKDKGVETAEVLLHVGLGTFRPLSAQTILQHKMHSEYYEISEQACNIINKARAQNRRVIAVGTTSVRVLESAASKEGTVSPFKGETSIFIYPPYKFKVIDGMITNFHLPESTLIMLVSAFLGREKTLSLYKHAIDNDYRFFSFGDAMLLL